MFISPWEREHLMIKRLGPHRLREPSARNLGPFGSDCGGRSDNAISIANDAPGRYPDSWYAAEPRLQHTATQTLKGDQRADCLHRGGG